jgi:hypothetical protein
LRIPDFGFAGIGMRRDTGFQPVLIARGVGGMRLFTPFAPCTHLKARVTQMAASPNRQLEIGNRQSSK